MNKQTLDELKDHVEAIVNDNFELVEYKDDVIKQLHDAIDSYFPTVINQ